MATFRVVLDACVLLPQTMCDVLLSIADADLFRPLWTPDLLDEVERNLSGLRFRKTPTQASHRVAAMRAAFPLAEEETRGYTELIAAMTNDPKDRHVLAAAVRANAAVIVTSNRKDFPAAAADPFDIEILTPDDFLCDQLDLDPDTVLHALNVMLERNRIPPRDLVELIDSLREQTPQFAAALLDMLRPDGPAVSIENGADLPELSDEQISAMSKDQRAAYLHLRDKDPAERARFLGHIPLVNAAWDFLYTACRDGDLRAAWPSVDPDYRMTLATRWVDDNSAAMTADGWDRDAVARALAEPTPAHPLWVHFERVHVRGFRDTLPDPDDWGIGEHTRLLGPGLETLFLHDTSALPGGVWRPNEPSFVIPLVMHHRDGRWMLHALGQQDAPPMDELATLQSGTDDH
jgi:predicted nucleic acid-binding protein